MGGERDYSRVTANPEVELSYRFAINIISGLATMRPERRPKLPTTPSLASGGHLSGYPTSQPSDSQT
jgi:hypothetical protein